MLLSAYIDRYSLTHELRQSTLEHYRWVVRSFESVVGPVQLHDLTGDQVSRWLAWLADHGRSPFTIKQRRISLLVLWRAAWEAGLAPAVQPVRKLRPLHQQPKAWSIPEVRRLLSAADRSSRSLFWGSLCRAAYDSGLRLGDLLDLRCDQVGRQIEVLQEKTGRVVTVRLRPTTLQLVRRQIKGRAGCQPVWPLWGRREAFYRAFRRLVASSGIRPGTFRWIRRTAATQVERVKHGSSTELLGHVSRATTETWYLDRSQLCHPPLPPL